MQHPQSPIPQILVVLNLRLIATRPNYHPAAIFQKQLDYILSNIGEDVTAQFKKGASIALERAISSGAKLALLKSKSPSCGNGLIYDGTFSGQLTVGDGIAASLLKEHGIMVFTENEIDSLLNEIE